MGLNIVLLIVIASGAFAFFWTVLIGLVWLLVAGLAGQMSRYWSVVLGTLRGSFLLGILVGIIQQPADYESVLASSSGYCLLGALLGALWGYYGLTQRLRSLIANATAPLAVNPPVRQPDPALPANPTVRPSAPPLRETNPQSEQPLEQPEVERRSIERPETMKPTPNPSTHQTRPVDSQAIARLLNRRLESRGIAVQVQHQGHKLRIGLRREAALNADAVVRFLQQSLASLNPQGIQQVEVIGQSGANAAQVWRRSFSLASASAAEVTPPNPPQTRSRPSPQGYQPPRDPRKFVIEIGAERHEVSAIIVWTIAIAFLVLDVWGATFSGIALLWLMLRLALALMPPVIAEQRGRPFLPWCLYGYINFPVVLVFAFLLRKEALPDFSHQDLRQLSFVGQSLREANFQGANVAGADFSQTDLAAANFHRANCTGARFDQASIRGTCFDQAILDQATFVSARQGEAAISVNKIFSSIPPILWSVLIALFMLLSLSGLLSIAISPLFRILLLIFAMYCVLGAGITWSLIKLTHLNREAAPLVLIGFSGMAIWAWASADEAAPVVPGLVLIVVGLAAIAQLFLYCNSWSKFGATMGALSTLCLTETWAVFFKFYAMPINMRWIFAVLSAILGCLIGAWIQQELTSFKAARLANTNFTTANLTLADFRDADIQPATFHRAQMKGIFLSTGRRKQLTTIAIRLSEQVTAYLQRFRT